VAVLGAGALTVLLLPFRRQATANAADGEGTRVPGGMRGTLAGETA
jgi:hypothetical protein